ncbi:MAG: hypothetical protein CMG66_00580 [Candidatus Marinimicrobia bacterium]|nr:hypothetical protein [Candidatus Neomarinimicrobiota bacterium]|tara:strand:- start:1244 stop:2296 length:1053 start_codon:yes stop_codon:yes gene_type:complete
MYSLVKQTSYIIILSVLLALGRYSLLDDYNIFESKKSSLDNSENIELNQILDDMSSPESIDISMAKSIYDQDIGIFIDARESIDFAEGHIEGSLNLPYSSESDYSKEFLDSLLYADKIIITYCSGEGCSLSEDLSYDLYENYNLYSVFYFEEGYPDWEKLNYPIKKGYNNETFDIEGETFFTFIDYIIILSICFIICFYFTHNYKYLIPIISRLILGFIFIYFSWDKILSPDSFAKLIVNYDMLPISLIKIGALILPWLEFIIGVCLILGVVLDTSATISISLLLLFILMISQALLRGKSIDCGCLLSDINDLSASNKRMHMIQRIIQDICFIAYAIIVKYRAIFRRVND